MKYLKLFENFDDDIKSICDELNITNWTVNSDGTVDVDGDVYLNQSGLEKLPLKFGKVSGHFICYSNQLTSLEGAPREVGGGFYCWRNQLTSLEGAPYEVGSIFNCSENQLTSLEGGPKEVGGNFNCENNKLTSLEGGPKEVGGNFYCSYNNLIGLEGAPSYVGGDFWCDENELITLEGGPKEIGGDFWCRNNLIFYIYELFPDHKSFMESLDYDYLRGNSIIKWKFKEALDEVGINIPESITGYKYI
jgi:hypothetical protein